MSAWQMTGYCVVSALTCNTVFQLGMAWHNRTRRRRSTPPPPPPKRSNAVRKVWR